VSARLVVTQNITVDGSIEFLDSWFDPSPAGADVADLQEEMEAQGSRTAAMLLGRQTFEDFRGYWPQHTDEPAGAELERLDKYVVSTTLHDPGWSNTTVLGGDPVDEIRLFIYPAVHGRGRSLVAEGTALPDLSLREARSFRSGVTLLRYAVC
jgi:dihydrofolate reductase